jgi:hypothetical protein
VLRNRIADDLVPRALELRERPRLGEAELVADERGRVADRHRLAELARNCGP